MRVARRRAGSPRCPARTSPRRSPATCRRRRSSASPDVELAQRIIDRLGRRRFRLYVNEDLLGVELAGALKNVVAIAAGAADGLGFGDNGKAGLLTRGLAEMMRLGIAAGANALTFAGLAGIGDLIATCGSRLSRNHQLGEQLAAGRTWAEIEATLPGTAEGAYTVARRWRSPIGSASRCRSPARSSERCSRARACSAASSTCSRASRRTSWPTRTPGWRGSEWQPGADREPRGRFGPAGVAC